MRDVKAALEAGADVNWRSEPTSAPIAIAIILNRAGIVNFLLEQGADPDKPVTVEVQIPSFAFDTRILGVRSLHIAAMVGNVEIVRLLLNRPHSSLNSTDSEGCTPLMMMCFFPCICVEVMRLLLEAGADPALANNTGCIPLHLVAQYRNMDLVDMLYAKAPATLNCRDSGGTTPLFAACATGNESMVSKLLSLGATESAFSDLSNAWPLAATVAKGFVDVVWAMASKLLPLIAMVPFPPHETSSCPLGAVVAKGFAGVVRVLLNEERIKAVGGGAALSRALAVAVQSRQATIIRLLLTAEGDEARSDLANGMYNGKNILHYGTGMSYPTAVNILLHAGADEAARDAWGYTPGDIIGVGVDGEVQIDRGKEVAISRMLVRSPAYRARLWTWPSGEEADVCGSGYRGIATGAADAVLSFPSGGNPLLVIGVHTLRPKKDMSSKFFVRIIGRYCAKD